MDGDLVVIESPDLTRTLHTITGWALDRGVELEGLTVSRPSLEDVYLEHGRPMRWLPVLARQVRYEQKLYWRSPSSAVFTFAFPILLLVIFATLNQGETISGARRHQLQPVLRARHHRVRRDLGLLHESGDRSVLSARRRRAQADTRHAVAALALHGREHRLLARGELAARGADDVGGRSWSTASRSRADGARSLLTLLIGAFCFCALGLAMTCVISTATASPAIVNGVLFPILFISGTFYPVQPSSILGRIASVFPSSPSSRPCSRSSILGWSGSGIEAKPLLLMLGWGIVALVVAVKRFRWEPRSS